MGKEKVEFNKHFLEEITFDTVFYGIEYFGDNRTQMFTKVDPTNGYIIGNCYKFDGKYYGSTPGGPTYDGYETGYDDGEDAGLTDRKSIKYWKVVTQMNEILLVPREPITEEWRFSLEEGNKHFGIDYRLEKFLGI